MDNAIQNLGPVVVLWLVALLAWLEAWHIHRKRHLPGEDPAE